jgi:glycosyltransferase involved in cell wall biosynthesis
LHVLLVGSDVVAYGAPRPDGRSWRQWAQEELALDPGRTHWLGALKTEAYHQVLACSQAHLYLTVPFVLSWSLLEAMAAGCSIVASNTPPVQEVLQDNHSALLVDFFDPEADASLAARLAGQAQIDVRGYGHATGLEAWQSLITTGG